MLQRYGWRIQPEDVVLIPGVVPGLNLACHMVASAGGAVLVQPPVYPHILACAKNARLDRQEAVLKQGSDGAYAIDWDEFTAAITAETRMFVMCNPHNPVGRVFRRDELTRIAEICLSRDLVICADEIHSDLVFNGREHVPIASLAPDVAQQTITLVAPSKTFNLAGLQCGFAVIPNAGLRRRFDAARQGLTPWVNTMGLIGAAAAYLEGQSWLNRLLPYLEANRDFLLEFVGRELSGVRMSLTEGTYLAWLDCRALTLQSPYRFFLDKARVALNDGPTFGSGGAGFVRLNFGCPRAILQQALERMKAALEKRSR
jgi:cysteine-S-conjugate beta-lyase